MSQEVEQELLNLIDLLIAIEYEEERIKELEEKYNDYIYLPIEQDV